LAESRAMGLDEGRVMGLVEGRTEERVEVAKSSLREGISIDTIIRITGLSRAEIESLR
jgi:predicted transposase/invertase (TIGR01784 family)